MSTFKCKMCGGTLEIQLGQTIAECEYCGTTQTVAKSRDEVISNLFSRANNLRMQSEFERAEQTYEKILEQDNTEAEAHWGIVLCRYGIEYVEDPKTFRRIPTCHRTSYKAVTADADYLAAMEYADLSQKAIYQSEAKAIDEIQKNILAIVKNEKPFDVFICYKESDESGHRTHDSVIANDIYHQLTQEGFKVFYAPITLEDKLGQAYEPYIFAALNSAKVMLVLGTKPEYYSAVWVKNEWARFLQLMKSDRSKLLIPCYRDMDPYDLPEEFSHLQAQDMSKLGFMQDLIRGIKKIAHVDEPKPTVVKETVISAGNANTAALLERAFMFLEDGDWESADEYCEKVLDIDPQNAEAYLGKLMAELNVCGKDQLREQKITFDNHPYYKKAIRFADDALKEDLSNIIFSITSRKKARAAKIRKICMISGISAVSIVAVILVITQIVIPNSQYNKAVALMEAEQYDEAIVAFRELDGYKDSEEQITVCKTGISDRKYNDAVALMEAERYNEAIFAFLELNGYKDSEEQIAVCKTGISDRKYNDAVALMEAGAYEEAIAAFQALNGYKDSEEQIKECKRLPLKNSQVGDYVFFGSYEQDNDTSNGKEAIEWLVLEKTDNQILVISKYALDCRVYYEHSLSISWGSCSLRKWLNGTFLTTAFSSAEQSMIPTATVSADKNPTYPTSPGNSTQDKVFLLSISEVNKYFSSNSTRQCQPTSYAADRGAHGNSANSNCWWWLRSPGYTRSNAAFVTSAGGVGEVGYDVDCRGAVRPALWIDLG